MPETIPLDEALHKASVDPASREAFYKQLLNSTVYVVGQIEDKEVEEEQGHVQLKHWKQPDGNYAMPFFATLECLKEKTGKDEPHLEIPVVELFRRTRGTTLVLTTSEISKAFAPGEVDVLLSSIMAVDPLTKALLRVIEEKSEASQRNFYHELINSKVFVIGHPKGNDTPTGETRQMAPDEEFVFASCDNPQRKGEKVLPFFSSIEHLKLIIPKDGHYMVFQALVFLSMARPMGVPLVLNPGTIPHKFFALEEVDAILNSVTKKPFENRQFNSGAKITLSPPTDYPQEMVRSLLDFLPKFPVVKAAYLTVMHEEVKNALPVMVIGFEADGDLIPMYRKAEIFLEEYGKEGMPIDFTEIKPGEKGLSTYFLEKVSPFYRRALPHPGDQQPSADEDKKIPLPAQLDKPSLLGRLKKVFGGKK